MNGDVAYDKHLIGHARQPTIPPRNVATRKCADYTPPSWRGGFGANSKEYWDLGDMPEPGQTAVWLGRMRWLSTDTAWPSQGRLEHEGFQLHLKCYFTDTIKPVIYGIETSKECLSNIQYTPRTLPEFCRSPIQHERADIQLR
jgi:hypothetical protein